MNDIGGSQLQRLHIFTLRKIYSPCINILKVIRQFDEEVRMHPIREYINCGSNCVVYVVECTACTLQYVSCSIRPLHARIAEHYK